LIGALLNEKAFPPMALSKNICNLVRTANNCQRSADSSRAIETSYDRPFGHVADAGHYQYFILRAFARKKRMRGTGRGAAAPMLRLTFFLFNYDC